MKTVQCPCGRELRPCNLGRHMKARHLAVPVETDFGHLLVQPVWPIRIGKGTDRRYDEVLPRGEGPHRFRIYRLRAGELQPVATCPEEAAVGTALVRLHGEREFEGDDSVGVLDTITDPGHWIVNPFTLGRRSDA